MIEEESLNDLKEEELISLLPLGSITQLRPSQLVVIKLWRGDGLGRFRTFEDCSKITGMSVENIRANVIEALKKLRKCDIKNKIY